MEKTIQQLESVIAGYAVQLYALDEEKWAYKPDPAKWSRKEVIGHLIDSAQNNIRRFIVARHEDKPKIIYAQDSWVAATDYQNYVTGDLIALWVLLNKHICRVLQNIPAGAEESLCDTGEVHSIRGWRKITTGTCYITSTQFWTWNLSHIPDQ